MEPTVDPPLRRREFRSNTSRSVAARIPAGGVPARRETTVPLTADLFRPVICGVQSSLLSGDSLRFACRPGTLMVLHGRRNCRDAENSLPRRWPPPPGSAPFPHDSPGDQHAKCVVLAEFLNPADVGFFGRGCSSGPGDIGEEDQLLPIGSPDPAASMLRMPLRRKARRRFVRRGRR